MPELPEVETTLRGISKKILNKESNTQSIESYSELKEILLNRN